MKTFQFNLQENQILKTGGGKVLPFHWRSNKTFTSINRWKPNIPDEDLSQCHFFFHKSHMEWPGR